MKEVTTTNDLEVVLCTLVAVVISFTSLFLVSRRNDDSPPFADIPVIPFKRHWLFGHLHSPPKSYTLYEKHRVWCVDHADPTTGLCSFYAMRKPIVSVLKAKHALKIFRSSTLKSGFLFAFPVRRFARKSLGSQNLILLNGRDWKRHRCKVLRSVQSDHALQAMHCCTLRVGETLGRSILQKIHHQQTHQSHQSPTKDSCILSAVQLMKMATLDIFVTSVLGKNIGLCHNNLHLSSLASTFDILEKDMIQRSTSLLSPTTHCYWLPTTQNLLFHQANRSLRNFLKEAVLQHIQQQHTQKTFANEKHNLMDQFMDSTTYNEPHVHGTQTQAQTQSDDKMVENVTNSLIVLLFAGYDTTAYALTWALYHIAKDPIIQEHCAQEAQRVLKKISLHEVEEEQILDSIPLDSVIVEFAYCHAVLMETLRLYPLFTQAFRILEKDVVLDGVTVCQGTECRIPLFYIHRDERNFDRPDEFLVERWVHRTKQGTWTKRTDHTNNDDKVDHESQHSCEEKTQVHAADMDNFLAFSAGARNCPGRKFAMHEGVMLLALILRRFKVELMPDYEVSMIQEGLLLKPKGDVPICFRLRR